MADKKKGFLSGLKSVFVEDEKPSKTEEPVAKNDDEDKDDDIVLKTVPRPALTRIRKTVVADDTIVEKLTTALETADVESYKTVFDTFDSLAEDVPNEEARMRAAVRVATKQGIDKHAILSDFDKLEAVLKEKEDAFDHDVMLQTKAAIESRSEKLKTLSASTEANHKRIEELQNEITKIQDDIAADMAESEKVRGEITESTEKIDGVKSAFAASMSKVKASVESKKELVTKILTPSTGAVKEA